MRRIGALLLSVLATPVASAATVTGTVSWSEPVDFKGITASQDARVCGASGLQRDRHVERGPGQAVAKAVVRLIDAPGPVLAPVHREVRIDGCRLRPRVLVLGGGSRLVFRSSDPVLHNVTIEGPQGAVLQSFNLVGAGQVSPAVVLQDPGRYRVRSRAGHHWMNAHILVLERGPVAQTSTTGGFRLEGVPDGRWSVEAWHPDLGVVEEGVVLDGDATRSISLRF